MTLKAEREFILVGDVNIAHQEIDLKNWKSNQKNSGFLPEERAWMTQLLTHGGLVDVFRTLNPKPEQYTWWSNRGQAWAKNVGWRLDYHLATPGIAAKAQREQIYLEQRFSRPCAGDHRLRLQAVAGCGEAWWGLWLQIGIVLIYWLGPLPDRSRRHATTRPRTARIVARAAASRLEPIIGGTLALLTHYARTPNLAAAEQHRAQPGADRPASGRVGRAADGVHAAVHRLAGSAGGAGRAAGRRVARRLADAAATQ